MNRQDIIKMDSILELKEFTVKSGKEKIDPWILITEKQGKIAVYINPKKLYRSLYKKNHISAALDTLLIDKIRELLEAMAKKEESYDSEGKDKQEFK